MRWFIFPTIVSLLTPPKQWARRSRGGDPVAGAVAGVFGAVVGNDVTTTLGAFTGRAVSAIIGFGVGTFAGSVTNATAQADTSQMDPPEGTQSEPRPETDQCLNIECGK